MAQTTPFTTAGKYASERHERALRNWRKRTRRRFWAIAIPTAVAYSASGLFFYRQVGFWIGLIVGMAVGILIVLYDSPPQYVTYWSEGADGERKTGQVLNKLQEKGFVVRHDLPRTRGNFDHVVVGPTGVFLLDSKLLSGTAELDGDDLRLVRSDDQADTYICEGLGRKLRAAAAELKTEIQNVTGTKTFVRAAVVLWGRTDRPVMEGDRVTFLHGSEVARWIEEHPSVLRPDQFRSVVAYFNSLARSSV